MINNITYLSITIIFLNILLFHSRRFIYGKAINDNENLVQNNYIIRNKRYFDAEAAQKEYDRNQTSTTRGPSGPEIVRITTKGPSLDFMVAL